MQETELIASLQNEPYEDDLLHTSYSVLVFLMFVVLFLIYRDGSKAYFLCGDILEVYAHLTQL